MMLHSLDMESDCQCLAYHICSVCFQTHLATMSNQFKSVLEVRTEVSCCWVLKFDFGSAEKWFENVFSENRIGECSGRSLLSVFTVIVWIIALTLFSVYYSSCCCCCVAASSGTCALLLIMPRWLYKLQFSSFYCILCFYLCQVWM